MIKPPLRRRDSRPNQSRIVFGVAVATMLLGLALAASHAAAADIKLDNFKVVIGDNGDRYTTWERTPNRVYVKVNGTDRQPHEHYFSDIPSAYYVLSERYGSPDYVNFTVSPADNSGRLIDARTAYYFWDNDRFGRGGTPLVLAYSDRAAADAYARSHPGTVLSYDDLTGRLSAWRSDNGTTIYWRGRDNWKDANWNRAWTSRWNGWVYDNDHGWWHRSNVKSSHRHRRHHAPVRHND